jgi:hypothetical protein
MARSRVQLKRVDRKKEKRRCPGWIQGKTKSSETNPLISGCKEEEGGKVERDRIRGGEKSGGCF